MARDWSATRQAEENLLNKANNEAKQSYIDTIKQDVEYAEKALSIMILIMPHNEDVDLMAAIRSMGALHARLARKLFEVQNSK